MKITKKLTSNLLAKLDWTKSGNSGKLWKIIKITDEVVPISKFVNNEIKRKPNAVITNKIIFETDCSQLLRGIPMMLLKLE